MYEHEDKLLARDINGVLHFAYVEGTEDGGCKVILLDDTCTSKPHGATPVTADVIRRRYNLAEGQTYPVVAPKIEDTNQKKSEQDKIAAMVQRSAHKSATK